jgi:cyclin B
MTNEQNEINSTMRAILVDWLVGVQMKFRLQPETLYLCVNIIDRYLSRYNIRRRRLQLLGITALFVACKYEETYPLEVKDCVYVTDRAYNRQEVLDMEFEIVKVLGFKMTVPTAYPFLQRFLHVTNAPKIIRDLASFYTERMLQEYCMLNFRASLVASAAVCLAWNNPTVLEDFEEAGINGKLPRVVRSFDGTDYLALELLMFGIIQSLTKLMHLFPLDGYHNQLHWILRRTDQAYCKCDVCKNPAAE